MNRNPQYVAFAYLALVAGIVCIGFAAIFVKIAGVPGTVSAFYRVLVAAKMEYRKHPNSQKRLVTSLASAKDFFGKEPVSLIDEARLEAYKTWRINEHKVRGCHASA